MDYSTENNDLFEELKMNNGIYNTPEKEGIVDVVDFDEITDEETIMLFCFMI